MQPRAGGKGRLLPSSTSLGSAGCSAWGETKSLDQKTKNDMNSSTSGWLVLTRNLVAGSHPQNDMVGVSIVNGTADQVALLRFEGYEAENGVGDLLLVEVGGAGMVCPPSVRGLRGTVG